jgi:hypothetical protein
MINKNKLVFDPADAANSDYVGSYLISAAGTEITHTNVGGKDGLDVNIINTSLIVTATDLDIRDLDAAQDNIAISDGTDTLSITASGQAEVAVTAALPAGNNNIGDVDIASMPGQFAEDSAHSSGALGNFVLGVRNDANVALTSTDLDYSPIATTSTGAVKVSVNFSAADGGALPTNQAVIAGYDGAAVQAIKTDVDGNLQVDILSLPGGLTGYAEDSAHVSGDIGVLGLVVRSDAGGSLVSADGDYAPLQVDANGALRVAATVDAAGDYAEDSVHASGDIGLYTLSVRQDTLASSTSASGDYQSFKTDALGRLWMNDTHQTMAHAAVSVGTSATDLVATDLANRKRILVQNLGTKKIYVGNSGVTSANGIEVFSGGSIELDVGPGIDLYAISGTAGQDVRVMELA